MSGSRDELLVMIIPETYCAGLGYINQFVSNMFDENAGRDPFLGEEPRRRLFSVDGKTTLVEIHDADMGSYRENSLFFRLLDGQAKAVILMYDVTSRNAFDVFTAKAHDWMREDLRWASQGKNDLLPTAGVVARSTEMPSPATHPTKRHRWFKRRRNRSGQPVAAVEFTCFPRLPAELQIAILRACLTSNNRIPDRQPQNDGVNLNVLLVCKFFYQEGLKIFWTENTFVHSKPTYLIADLTWAKPANRVVLPAEGRLLANRLGCKYFETSSRVHREVEAVFIDLVSECRAIERQSIGHDREGKA